MEPGTIISIVSAVGRLFKVASTWWSTRRLETLKNLVEEKMQERQARNPAPLIFSPEHLAQATSAPTKRLRPGISRVGA